MLFKMGLWFFLRLFVDGFIDARVAVDEERFTNALKNKWIADDLSTVSSERYNSGAKQVLTSLLLRRRWPLSSDRSLSMRCY